MKQLVEIVVIATAGVASADELEDRSEGKPNGLTARAGLNIGAVHEGKVGTGFLLGAEVSVAVVHFKSGYFERNNPNDFFYMPGMPVWGGAYFDLVRDFQTDSTRITFGPELGYGPVGVDGGLVVQRGTQDRSGWCIRPVLSASVLQLYVRIGEFTDDMPDKSFQEIGVLVKLGRALFAW